MGFWRSETLWDQIPALGVVIPYNKDFVKYGAYELGLGVDYYLTSDETGVKHILGENDSLKLPPGQFAILVTKEKVTIPNSVIGLISIKSSFKVRGLVNVSGFHVDPGFTGQLHFSVYNAGSQPIILTQGERLFVMWLCTFDWPTSHLYDGVHNHQAGLTSQEVMAIQGDIASPASLKKQLDELKTDVDKKFHALDHSMTFWRAIVGSLVVGLILLFIKFFVDLSAAHHTSEVPVSTPTTMQRAGDPPTVKVFVNSTAAPLASGSPTSTLATVKRDGDSSATGPASMPQATDSTASVPTTTNHTP